jgi:hypothetical protein
MIEKLCCAKHVCYLANVINIFSVGIHLPACPFYWLFILYPLEWCFCNKLTCFQLHIHNNFWVSWYGTRKSILIKYWRHFASLSHVTTLLAYLCEIMCVSMHKFLCLSVCMVNMNCSNFSSQLCHNSLFQP